MNISINPPFDTVINRKNAEILIHDVFNEDTLHVDIDKGWINLKIRKILVNMFETLINCYFEVSNPQKAVILTPDNLRLSYGLIPILSTVAYKMNLNLAIWKELGNFSNYTDIIYGDTQQAYDVFIIQDVINYGGTFFRMSDELNKTQWKVKKYLTLFSIKNNGFPYNEILNEVKKRLINLDNKDNFIIESLITIDIPQTK
ncbi:MAG: hypothetical protein GYA51_00985 [Candidatus Methanofastidiosa archaeon]|nr:hypothetical protein [Candidatus Methanofastidiosa archaeon]